MGGLITLLLPTSTTSHANMPDDSHESKRRSCLVQSSCTSERPVHRRQHSLPTIKQSRRASGFVYHNVPLIPKSESEWKTAIDEVKKRFVARKYRSCSMRCCEILDNLRDTSALEPLYLVYLHFYAASSFEWCARPLSSSSTYRTKLLHDAQNHYNEAESLIFATQCDIAERALSPPCTSLASPISPGLSACSSIADSSSAVSSPRTSISLLGESVLTRPGPRERGKTKKKVSFSSLPAFFEYQPEPYIRPDSPTLGWEDTTVQPGEKIADVLPLPPFEPDEVSSTWAKVQQEHSKSSPKLRVDINVKTINSDQGSYYGNDYPQPGSFDLNLFLQTRSINRIGAHLSLLREQICRHRASVSDLFTKADDTPSIPSDSPLIQTARISTTSTALEESPPTQVLEINVNRPVRKPSLRVRTSKSMRSLSASADNSTNTGLTSPPPNIPATPPATPSEGDLQERIERLRASGWRRKRFDSRRYEILREQAMAELPRMAIVRNIGQSKCYGITQYPLKGCGAYISDLDAQRLTRKESHMPE
ncbi:hypothetical protein GGR57DRAFT_416100 [Xylariaceae sp. FL1272]|nr:hypothetical protein GGR57DRAFT_416100 [Xylariaceae sp. FL1272]